MQSTIYVGISRLSALSRQMDVVANNIANASTPAFKGENLMFVEHLAKQGFSKDEVAFVNDMGTRRDFSEGTMQKTNNPLDMALKGEGYFVVDSPAGERYTRLGRFRQGEDNFLVTAQGYQVLDQRRLPIQLPDRFNELQVLPTGQVIADDAEIARLGVSYFNNEQELRKTADGYYKFDGELLPNPRPDEDKTEFLQGHFEGSNVNAVQEMTNMIAIQRSFEMASNLLEKENERIQRMMRTMGSQQ